MDIPEFKRSYDWLVGQMKKRIGPPPESVIYPVWAWHLVLNDYPMLNADSEEELKAREDEYDALPEEEQERIRVKSWEQIFDIDYFDYGWDRRGYEIQATFWELKKEQIRSVRFFEGATPSLRKEGT